MVPWAESAGSKAKLEDGKLIGPFNTTLFLSTEMAASFLVLQAGEHEHTSLSERVRHVVILTVGAVWKSEYELYAHSAVARKVGISEKAIAALAQGTDAEQLSEAEKIAQRFTWQLTAEHQVPEELYSRAVAAFGIEGIVDLGFPRRLL